MNKGTWTYIVIILMILLLAGPSGHAQDSKEMISTQEEVWTESECEELQKNIDFGKANEDDPSEEDLNKESDQIEDLNVKDETPSWLNGTAGKTIAYALIAILVIGLIILLYKSQIAARDMRVIGHDIVTGEEEDLNVVETDFDRLLRLALEKGDYRLAVRMLFLNTLKCLHEGRLIIWQKHKTNHHYVEEMRGHSDVMRFRQCVFLFEVVWYGEKAMNQQDFDAVKSLYEQFQESTNGQ